MNTSHCNRACSLCTTNFHLLQAEAKSAPEARTWGQQQMAVMQAPPIPLRQNPVTVQDTALAFLVMIALQLGFLAGRQQPQDLQSVLVRACLRSQVWAHL